MDAQQFKKEVCRVQDLLADAGDPFDIEYWSGYRRGLRRAYHGATLGTQEDHRQYLALLNHANKLRRKRGQGYRDGLNAFQNPSPKFEVIG